MRKPTLYKCVICGKEYRRWNPNQRACSRPCGWKLAQKTCMDKYGVKVASMTVEASKKQQHTTNSRWLEVQGRGLHDVLEGSTEGSREIALNTFRKLLDSVNAEYSETTEVGGWHYDFQLGSTLVCVDDTFSHNDFALSSNISRYHLSATRNGNDNGYDVVHIFDWDDPIKIAMMFQPKKKIKAEDCIISEIDKLMRNSFLSAYHVNGPLQNNGVTYGLYYNDILVEILAAGPPRFQKKCSHEIFRICSDPEFEVIGGSKKLFDHFVSKHTPDSVIAYRDRAKLPVNMFPEIGMEFLRHNEPSTIWSKGIDHKSESVLCRVGYDALFGTSYGKSNNKQLMLDAGWLPVQDCGQSVYMYRKEEQ